MLVACYLFYLFNILAQTFFFFNIELYALIAAYFAPFSHFTSSPLLGFPFTKLPPSGISKGS